MKRVTIACSLLTAAFASAAPAPGAEADWPTFRGPDRTGVASESGLL